MRLTSKDVIRGDDGAMIGIEAFGEGQWTRFEADAMILAAGDYGSIKEKWTRYYSLGYGSWKVYESWYNTGEVIEAAMGINAKSKSAVSATLSVIGRHE